MPVITSKYKHAIIFIHREENPGPGRTSEWSIVRQVLEAHTGIQTPKMTFCFPRKPLIFMHLKLKYLNSYLTKDKIYGSINIK